MSDIAQRFPENPLLMPKDLKASNSDLQIISLLNPGVFTFEKKILYNIKLQNKISKKYNDNERSYRKPVQTLKL